MANAFVQIAPDSTGKKIQTFENTVGSEIVEAQAVVQVDPVGAPLAPLTDEQLRAAPVPVSLPTAAMTWVSVKSAAPAANAVQATTGALTAGNYDFDIMICASDTIAVGKGLVIEHRNTADNATLFNLGACQGAGSIRIELRGYAIATNERIRVIAGTAAGAASSMYVSAIGRRSS